MCRTATVARDHLKTWLSRSPRPQFARSRCSIHVALEHEELHREVGVLAIGLMKAATLRPVSTSIVLITHALLATSTAVEGVSTSHRRRAGVRTGAAVAPNGYRFPGDAALLARRGDEPGDPGPD
jgi:hypothetical protein